MSRQGLDFIARERANLLSLTGDILLILEAESINIKKTGEKYLTKLYIHCFADFVHED